MEGRECPGTVGDPALLSSGMFCKSPLAQLEDRIVPESIVPSGAEGDCSLQGSGKDLYAMFTGIGNDGGEPGFAINSPLHQSQYTGIADGIQNICSIRA